MSYLYCDKNAQKHKNVDGILLFLTTFASLFFTACKTGCKTCDTSNKDKCLTCLNGYTDDQHGVDDSCTSKIVVFVFVHKFSHNLVIVI